MRAVEIADLTMAYGRHLLFQSLSLTLQAGECATVIGPNGSGKSTFLKVVAGLTRPESGEVRFLDSDGSILETRASRMGYVGYAAPDLNIYEELTGDENLALFARLSGGVPNSTMLGRVGLAKARGRDRAADYSSGMRQRLKLAVSLLGDPPLLLWDEPTATLDEAGKGYVEAILADHARCGGLAIIATNDSGEASRWGDRQIILGE